MSKRGRGRPRLLPEQQRINVFCRVTDAQAAALDKVSFYAKLSSSRTIRGLISRPEIGWELDREAADAIIERKALDRLTTSERAALVSAMRRVGSAWARAMERYEASSRDAGERAKRPGVAIPNGTFSSKK